MEYSLIELLFIKFPALQYRNFRLFLFGQSVSLVGTWMQRTAEYWLIYELTGSPFLVGLLGVFQYTPMLLFSLFAGVFADRFHKRDLLIFTQFIQMVESFILAGLWWSGNLVYWHIFLMGSILGLAQAFDNPTRQSFFIDLVGKKALSCAIGMNSTIVNLAKIAGPGIGGVFIYYFGAGACFFVNGLSFLAVIISLIKISVVNDYVRAKGKNIYNEIFDGLSYIYNNKTLFKVFLIMFVVCVIAQNSMVIIPIFAKDVLQSSVDGYSFLLMAMGLGSLVGSLFFAGKKIGGDEGRTLFKYALLLSGFLALTGLGRSFWQAGACLFGFGFFNMLFMATANSTIQLNSTNEYRGRTMSVYSLVFIGTTPLGNFLAGLATDNYGAAVTFLSCGLLTAVCIVLLFTHHRWRAVLHKLLP